MPNCKNCGKEISESQYDNYQQLCPDCIRIIKTVDRSKAKSGMWRNLILAIIFTFAFATFALVVVIFITASDIPIVALIIPLIMAIIHWYFFFRNRQKSQFPYS